MGKLAIYGNFIKVEHSLFSLPLILCGSFLAVWGLPDLKLLVLIIIAAVGARTAALAINRILDARIDVLNPRTKDRELPSGKINLTEAIVITISGLVIYLISAYFICDLVLYLSPIPLVVFIIYPLMKRFTPLCHFGVGLGLALAPLAGWVAVTCSLDNLTIPLLLFLFTLFWVSGFDIIYATLDEKFDKEKGIYSIISVYGKSKGLLISAVLHILAFLSLVALYLLIFKSYVSLIFLLITGFFLYLEHRKSENVDLAFFKINIVVGFAVFIFVLSGIYLP
ncbi:MAG: 4-hydroxybenzoate octaprenyltransferase [Candidatus Dadabacteria bacterium]|nr:4-hydroxybenzoate octaprenyltransferase [Candidatus Dadabacteria bacterium]NIS09404.1 4-hydroxybenzoate octaprenyltransferase [Candidatus Dadabacteria bacterium]NIV42541.1 4-hydroxybenzoate octaprenyltransferase [Candidatus Dadabacteria bacterium]NIY22642.1 4-hydroxybenzoate octaprenyltransferase [Candidatus Dadabacteria bacterium]